MQSVFVFSEKLRLEAIAYFEKRFNEPVTHEQADLYLAQLAELVAAFEGGQQAAALCAAPAGSPNPSLEAVPEPSLPPLLILDSSHT